MTKEQVKNALAKMPHELTKEELVFLFSVFSFHIKEYELRKNKVIFEIHFKTSFIIRIEYPIGPGLMSFNNNFIDFGEGSHGLAMGRTENTAELMLLFINMFNDNLLSQANWEAYWDEDVVSSFNSLEEANDMLEYVKGIMLEEAEKN